MSRRSIRKRRHQTMQTYDLTRDERVFLERCAERIREKVYADHSPWIDKVTATIKGGA